MDNLKRLIWIVIFALVSGSGWGIAQDSKPIPQPNGESHSQIEMDEFGSITRWDSSWTWSNFADPGMEMNIDSILQSMGLNFNFGYSDFGALDSLLNPLGQFFGDNFFGGFNSNSMEQMMQQGMKMMEEMMKNFELNAIPPPTKKEEEGIIRL